MPLALPQSSFTHSTAHAFRRSHSYQGLDPHHDLTRSRPLIIRLAHAGLAPDLTSTCARHSGVAEGFHTFRFGPSSGVLSLSTVCSAIGLAGLFRPAAMSRVPPFQGPSLSVQQRSLVDSALPPCLSTRTSSPVARLPLTRASASRLCSTRSSVAPTKR